MVSLIGLGVRVPFPSRFAHDLKALCAYVGIGRESLCEIYVCDVRRMRELNKRFRHKDRATTVLSFEIPGGFPAGKGVLVGEVYVCPEQIGHSPFPAIVNTGSVGFYEKLMYYIVHGVLHVRGYDHDADWFSRKRMEQTELLLWYRLCSRL